jgi:hypothetical protein
MHEEVKKIKYPFVVIGDYQPAYMDSPPDIRITYHSKIEFANAAVKRHMVNGACSIELLEAKQKWEQKYR